MTSRQKTVIPVFYIPKMQIRHKSVLLYSVYNGPQSRWLKEFRTLNMRSQQKKQYGGQMSPGARKRLTKAVNILIQSIKPKWIYNEVTKRKQLHRLSFITLTVSDPTQKLTGKEAYNKLLSHFLQWMRRTLNVNTYIWKAELQKNGQIHYHITTTAFINYQLIRDKWNNLQKRNGLLEKYHEDKGHYDPNSTDIHEVEQITDLSAYLIKYITKSYQNAEDLGGKVWDCSQNLKAAKYYTLELTEEHETFLKAAVEEKLAVSKKEERYEIIKFREPPAECLLTEKEFANYQTYFNVIAAMRHRERVFKQRKKEKVT